MPTTISARSGMMLLAEPAWKESTVTTVGSSGWMLRETIGLQRHHDRGAGDDRIGRLLRLRAVPAAAVEGDARLVDRGHDRAFAKGELAEGQARARCEAQNRVARKARTGPPRS